MPLYEYNCQKCGKNFELLVNSQTEIACEYCGSKDVSKLMSTFAAQSGSTPEMPPCAGGCCGFNKGRCGSGMCGAD